MGRDFRTLLHLEGLRLLRQLIYWLRVLGVEASDTRAYQAYFVGFAIFWVVSVWAWAVDNSHGIGRLLMRDDVMTGQALLPAVMLLATSAYVFLALRSSPFKLSAPATLLVAASPAHRGALLWMAYAVSALLPVIITSTLLYFAALTLSWLTALDEIGIIGLQALLTAPLLVAMLMAFAWIIALIKQQNPQRGRMLFLVPVLGVAWATTTPETFLPGVWWSKVVGGDLTWTHIGGLTALLFVVWAILWRVGSTLNITAVIEDSHTYSRLVRMGRFNNVDLAKRIQRQTRLTKRHRRLTLPDTHGTQVVFSRAVHQVMTYAPASVLELVFTGVLLASAGNFLAQAVDINQLQVWLLVIVLLVQWRPIALTTAFRQDVQNPFVRQFIPLNPLALLVRDSALPVLWIALGGFGALLLQAPDVPSAVMGMALLLCIVMLLVLCQAVSLIRPNIIGLKRIAYDYVVLFCAVVLIGVLLLTGDIVLLLGAAIGLILLLANIVADGR